MVDGCDVRAVGPQTGRRRRRTRRQNWEHGVAWRGGRALLGATRRVGEQQLTSSRAGGGSWSDSLVRPVGQPRRKGAGAERAAAGNPVREAPVTSPTSLTDRKPGTGRPVVAQPPHSTAGTAHRALWARSGQPLSDRRSACRSRRRSHRPRRRSSSSPPSRARPSLRRRCGTHRKPRLPSATSTTSGVGRAWRSESA